MKAKITSVDTSEDGQHLVIAYDIVNNDGTVNLVSGELYVGTTADPDTVRATIAERVRSFEALVNLQGQTVE